MKKHVRILASAAGIHVKGHVRILASAAGIHVKEHVRILVQVPVNIQAVDSSLY